MITIDILSDVVNKDEEEKQIQYIKFKKQEEANKLRTILQVININGKIVEIY